jgi:hypothetical protein
MHPFQFAYDLLRLIKAWGKGFMQIQRSRSVETKKKLKYYSAKKKGVYSGFIPLDLTKMVVSWENINLF